MPWIDPSIPLRLTHRRADVLAFWIVGSLVLTGVSMVAARTLQLPAPWAWGLAGPLLAMSPRLVSAVWFETAVTIWNKLTRRYGRLFRAYVLYICYFTLFAALGLRRDSINRLVPPRPATQWKSRRLADPWLAATRRSPVPAANWYDGLLAAARSRGNGWTVLLLPIVFLLIVFGTDERDQAPPASTYTLY